MEQSKNQKERPAWMQDDLVKNIPQKKLDFLGKMFAESQGKNQKELMTLLLPMLKIAKQENLAFSQQEMNAAISAIKKHSSSEELQQIDKILQKGRGKPLA